ncbi:MAG: dethiobiotin synthase [Gammaproteobacteria bacterium]|nr:dethiobiotin synthase [Gammaproteobacteria bacterium]
MIRQTPSLPGIFITGTSTGVGKTYIGVLLAKALTEKQFPVVPRKPVESGCDFVQGELLPSDAQALMQAAAYGGTLADVCPYRFQPPISPARAARLAHTQLTTEQLVDACLDNSEGHFLLVEGAGGFYSPITGDGLNADLAVALQLPVLLVAENTLGVLNQVLLNVEAIRTRGLELAGIVLNKLNDDPDGQMDNATDLRERLACGVYLQEFNRSQLSDALIDAIATRTL